ncbi:MAG: potassium channel protein [Actinomycetota bacterium]|nr:potassium channel protein [Actinomycetota bacterium]
MTPTRRLRIAFSIYFGVLLVGVVGYQLLEGMNLLDALYMTVITVTTVGFGEVAPLDGPGKVFTVLLIVGGVASATYAAVSAAEFVVEGHLRRIIERRRMERRINAIDEHVIVCGYGRVGRHLVAELMREGMPFVVVDNDEDKIAEVAGTGFLHVEGDATAEHVLLDAGLERAQAVVACVNTDADNVLIALTAKGLRPGCTVVGRIKADENEAKLRRAGADRVIAPSTIGGRRIAQLLTRPVVSDFLDGIGAGGIEYTLEEVPVRAGSPLDNHTLRQAAIRETYGCTVLAVLHAEDGSMDTHPSAESVLHDGDVLVVMGSQEEVARMRDRFRPT